METESASPEPGVDGAAGVSWEVDVAGNATGNVRLFSPADVADQWLTIQVFGGTVRTEFQLGPYEASGAEHVVPVALGAEAADEGLVQVFVRVDIVDPKTQELRGSHRSRPAYVTGAGTPSLAWFTEAAAEEAAIRPVSALATLDGVVPVVEGVVGLEVAR